MNLLCCTAVADRCGFAIFELLCAARGDFFFSGFSVIARKFCDVLRRFRSFWSVCISWRSISSSLIFDI